MREHFDVVVAGGRLSAVLAAAVLARRGLKILLVDQGELSGIDGGLLWDLVPSSEDSESMRTVSAELGLDDAIRRRTVPLSSTLR